MRRYSSLAVFLVLVLGGGTLIGFLFLPGEWYAQLVKPSFNPPNWIFAPVWTLLYVLIAIAGWRVWRHGARSALTVWLIALALNFFWSPVFFGAHRPGVALVVVAAMLATIIAFIAMTWRRERLAALLFVPYTAWTAFAALLNAAVWWLN